MKKYFYLKDHLGNIRVTVDENGEVKGYNDYYPFGLRMPGRSMNTALNYALYKYSSKELDEENGINWYYFGARYYDPMIGRWWSVDPKGYLRPWESPFCYTGNNPINRIDVDGNYWIEPVLIKTVNPYFPNKVTMYTVNFDSRLEISLDYALSFFIPGYKAMILENRGYNLTKRDYFEDIAPGLFAKIFKAPGIINLGLGIYSIHGNLSLFSLIDDPLLIKIFNKLDYSFIKGAIKVGSDWYFNSKGAAEKAVTFAKKYLYYKEEQNKKKRITLLEEISSDKWEKYDPSNW